MSLSSIFQKVASRMVLVPAAAVLVLALGFGLFLFTGKDNSDTQKVTNTPQLKVATTSKLSSPQVAAAETTDQQVVSTSTPKPKTSTSTSTTSTTTNTTQNNSGTGGNQTPSTPTTPATPPAGPSNTPTKSPFSDNPQPPAGFACKLSQNNLALSPGQETGWITMSTSDGSNVFWEQFYKNMIWKDGTNSSPSAPYWMVVDFDPGDYIASSVKFKVRLSPTAPLTGTPGTGTYEQVGLIMVDASRDIAMECDLHFTVVTP